MIAKNLRENLRAVIIGVQEYPLIKIRDRYGYLRPANLSGSIPDALALQQLLLDDWNLSERHVTTLCGNVKRADALKCIESMLKSLKEEDNFLFFYAGHGILGKGDGKSYLTFSDSKFELDDNLQNVIEIKYLNKMFLKCKAGVKVRIFDCCHSGEGFNDLREYFKQEKEPRLEKNTEEESIVKMLGNRKFFWGNTEMPEESMQKTFMSQERISNIEIRSSMNEKILGELMESQKGWITFCACNLDEKAQECLAEGTVHGLFTNHFIKGIRTRTGLSKEEPFYIEDLKHYVYDHVLTDSREMARKYPKDYDEQHMQYQCSLSGLLTLD